MDGTKERGRFGMSDSGVGSLGSESDTSPSQVAGTQNSGLENHSPSSTDRQVSDPVGDNAVSKDTLPVKHKIHNKFIITYLGNVELDKRYTQPQFWKVILQWIVAEIKRYSTKHVICLEIDKGLLSGVLLEKDRVIFQHNLHHLSKFSRTHQDTRCFAYLTKSAETTFLCHVYQTSEESMVLDIFKSIRDATKSSAKENTSQQQKQLSDPQSPESGNIFPTSLFEVLYIGKIIVSDKKAPPTFIDDAVAKFQEYEENKVAGSKVNEEETRSRNSSGISVNSLPSNLEQDVNVKENELAKQAAANAASSNESNLSGLSTASSSETNLSSSSSDTIPAASPNASLDSSLATQLFKQISGHLDLSGQSQKSPPDESSDDSSDVQLKGGESLQRTAVANQYQASKNRTMLLQIGRSEICLISPDRKRSILKTSFRDISFCSQGINSPEYFGFISRDLNASSFFCYVFKCVTESMAEEVMQTLKLAFNAAFQQSSKTHMCELCPMHQLHKLATEIDKHACEDVIEILHKRIEQLNESDQAEITEQLSHEKTDSLQEKAEVYMITLRHMSEDRQKDHTHISDPNKSAMSYEFTLTESAKSRHSKLDDLKHRAKKSLTESFETIKERVRHTSGEAMKEMLFRDRSNSWGISRSQDENIPYTSPIASPTSMIPNNVFSLNSPSPIKEEMAVDGDGSKDEKHIEGDTNRCSPIDTESPSTTSNNKGKTLREMHESFEQQQQHRGQGEHKLERELFTRSLDDAAALSRSNNSSPLKAMFLRAGNKSELPFTPKQPGSAVISTSPFATPKLTNSPARQLKRTGSWRLSIFERVVTPVVTPAKLHRSHSLANTCPNPGEDPLPSVNEVELCELGKSLDKKITAQRYRMLWKKAILETLLIIRMKRNVSSLQTRPDDEPCKVTKLDYEEITPCLKQVTKVWDELLKTQNRKQVHFDKMKISQALKDGVPRVRRGAIWQLLVEQHKLNHPGLQKDDSDIAANYEDLLKQLTTHQHAILIDLGRTFPGHPYFSTQLGSGQLSLFNILKAYSLLDKEVGYCQGLSFVAGILLMHMDEMETFNTLRYMMFVLGFRKQYRPDMQALQLQMYQLSRLLHDRHRDLYDHLDKYEIAPTLYAAPWFLTMFASQFPLGFVARVFDLIFLQGMEVVLKVALVVLGNHKELIKGCENFEHIVDFLKTTLPSMGIIQMERVFNQVYSMDCSKQLNAYEVEYHVLQEEMISTPQRGEHDHVNKLEMANHNLKKQNLELLEQLQTSHNINHSLEIQIHTAQAAKAKLNSHIRTLELERAALLNTMARIQQVVPEEQLQAAGIEIPTIPRNMTITNSPIHNPSINKLLDSGGDSSNNGNKTHHRSTVSELDKEVAALMEKMSATAGVGGSSKINSAATGTGNSKQLNIPAGPHRIRRPSSSEN